MLPQLRHIFAGVDQRRRPLPLPAGGSTCVESTPSTLPADWPYYTMWQYTSSGPIVGDHNKFNGAYDRVVALANG